MSSSALFTTGIARNQNKNLIELKAGKMTKNGTMVHPDNRKGQLYIYQSEDSLMHFCWKDRTTGIVEDDLIIFPDDCEFKQVEQCKTGKVYLLRFKSSSRKFFFWLQDPKIEKNDEKCKKINDLLNNPPAVNHQRNVAATAEGDLQNLLNNMSQQQLMQLFGGVGQAGGFGNLLGSLNRPASAARPSATPSDSSDQDGTNSTQNENNIIRLSDLQTFLSGIPISATKQTSLQKRLAKELANLIPSTIKSLQNLHSNFIKYIPQHDELSGTLSSPQFAQALIMFWSAVQSGEIGPVLQQFGLNQSIVAAAHAGDLEKFLVTFHSQDSDSGEDKEQNDQSSDQHSSNPDESLNRNVCGKKDDDEGMPLD